MTSIHEGYGDLLDSDDTEIRHCLIGALDHIYTGAVLPPSTRDSILAAIRHPGATAHQEHRQRLPRPCTALIPIAFLLVGVGVVAALRASSPVPVSAAMILQRVQRAAAVPLAPNSALHVVSTGASPGTIERYNSWSETDARGQVTREASSLVTSNHGMTTSILRYVDRKHVTRGYYYEPASKYLRKFTSTASEDAKTPALFGGLNVLDGAAVAKYLTKLAHQSPAGVRLLPRRLIDGAPVYPVHVERSLAQHKPGFTAYFDTQSYVLRGIDGSGSTDQVPGVVMPSLMDIKDTTEPLSAVPPHTFDLNPPSGSHVIP